MKQRIICKTLAVAVIILFLGLAIQPSVATAVSNNLPEQPDDVKGLVAQIRVMIDEILEKYGHIPMVRNLCDAILNTLGLLDNKIIICIILYTYVLITVFIRIFIPYPYLPWIDGIFVACFFLWLIICTSPNSLIYKLHFESIYTMLNVNDNIQSFDGCPCLQE